VDVVSRRGPLSGIRVIDLCRQLPGAFATGLLGDMGAEVIKVEDPGGGDPMRAYEPRIGDSSAYTWVTDRNKRSVALKLSDPRGAALVRRLGSSADAVLESFRPGVAEHLGVGPADMQRENPRLVYCSISGYGATGPLAGEAGHDINYIGRAGVLSVTGVDRLPAIPGVQVADLAGGALMGLTGLLAAMLNAARTGRGDHVEVSMTDGAFALMAVNLAVYCASGREPGWETELLNGSVPCYNVYTCADGRHLTVGALEEKFWIALCEGVGRVDLIATRFDERAVHAWRAHFATRTRDEWLTRLDQADACVGPVNSVSEATRDPQLLARGMYLEVQHPSLGSIGQIGRPIGFRDHPPFEPARAPSLGEATLSVLDELGVAQEEIESLAAEGVTSW
jgi:crotonobetainyl-CoA:carnitine CoA-transferase CaiB-like acyl-CoA transferase